MTPPAAEVLNEEVDQNIKLFFYDPIKSRDEYIKAYKKFLPERYKREGGYRYSTLFLCFKDIKHCLVIGKELEVLRANVPLEEIHPAFFAAILLINIALQGVSKTAFRGNFTGFIEKYMEIKDKELQFGLRELRNAIEHSGYSLYSYYPQKPKHGQIQEKIYFSLGLYNELIIKNNNWLPSYPSRMFNINPRKLYLSFKKATIILRDELLDRKNNSLRDAFKNNLDIDNWIFISEGISI